MLAAALDAEKSYCFGVTDCVRIEFSPVSIASNGCNYRLRIWYTVRLKHSDVSNEQAAERSPPDSPAGACRIVFGNLLKGPATITSATGQAKVCHKIQEVLAQKGDRHIFALQTRKN